MAVLQTAEPVEGRIALALLEEEDSLQVGDDVSALGYPAISDNATSEGFLLATVEDVTLTDGTVSRFFDSVSVTAEEGLLSGHLIQSTATINAGNSGGPLVNDQGGGSGHQHQHHLQYGYLRVQRLLRPADSLCPGSPGLLGDSLRHRCHPKPGAPCQQPGRNCRLPAGGWFGRGWKPPTGRGLCSSSSGPWW